MEITAKEALIKLIPAAVNTVSLFDCWSIYFMILGIFATVISIAATLNQEIRINLVASYLLWGSRYRLLYFILVPIFFLLSIIDVTWFRLFLIGIIFFMTLLLLIQVPTIFDRECYYKFILHKMEKEFKRKKEND